MVGKFFIYKVKMYQTLKRFSLLLPFIFYPFTSAWAECNIPYSLVGKTLLNRVSTLYSANARIRINSSGF